MSRIKELREKQARIHAAATSKLDEIKDDTTAERAAEINVEFDRAMTEFDELQVQIDREERLARASDRLRDPDPRRPNGRGQAGGTDEPEPVSYREAFADYLRAGGNTGEMRPEARAVLRQGFREVEHRGQTAGVNAAGGFTVPVELQNILVQTLKAWGPMYDEAITSQIVTESGNVLPIPTIDDTTKTVSVTAEGATLPDTGAKDAVFAQKQLEAYSFNTEWVRVSFELMKDSIFNIEQLIGGLLGERLARRSNLELTVGTGSNAPNGIVTASSLGVTAASATAVTADEIINLVHTVDPAYRRSPKCRFMFHDNILRDIRKLKDGQGNYLWQMGDVKAGEPARILGHEFSVNQDMAGAQAAAARIMLFGDFSRYYVRKVGAPIVGAIQDKDFWPGFGIAGYLRLDGELLDAAAIKYLRNA